MKRMRLLLLGLVVLLMVGVVFRNGILRRQLEKVLTEKTGFGLELDRVKLGLSFTTFEIEGARLLNPPDFPESSALDLKQVRVDFSFWSLFSREIRFHEVILDIPKLVVVRKADGETNAERLGGTGRAGRAGGGSAPGPGGETKPAPTGEKKEPRGFRIDRLVLRVGAVEFRDYSKAKESGEPAVTAMTLNVDQEHRDITSLSQLGSLVLGGSIQQMGLFLIGQELQDKDSKLNKKIKKAAGKLEKQLNSLFGAPQEK
jgi:uncharacterized protein involved in outer membrane biogenesis